MNMKPTYITIGLAFIFISIFHVSCIDDKGNYDYVDYTELHNIIISGLQDTVALRNATLNIEPILENIKDESVYEYTWYAHFTTTAGKIIKRDTLATTKNLSTELNLEGGEYYLYFQIKDVARDIYAYERVKLDVVESEFFSGWYVLKDTDNQTDFDYINLDDKVFANVLRDITYTPTGNNMLKGKAVKMMDQPARYYHVIENEDGTKETLVNQSALHIMSTEDFKTFNSKNMRLFKNYEDQFYGPPEKMIPQDVNVPWQYGGDVYLLNGGKLHSIYGMSDNIGKFGGAKVAETSTYDLHPGMLAGSFDALVFDKVSRSFWRSSSSAQNYTKVAVDETKISPINMNAQMVDLLPTNDYMSFSPKGYAIMQSTTDNEEYYIALVNPSMSYIFTTFDTIPRGSLMPKAKVKAAPNLGNYIYYAYDNKLYAYKDAKDLEMKESLIKELPAGETISFIKTIPNPYTKEASVVVLANKNNNWKLYLFDLIGSGNPEVQPEPHKVIEGTGNARYVMVR